MPYAGDQLAYEDFGPGPVVVLLHGFPLNRSMWKAQVSELGTVYRVIVPDLRGQGQSAAPEGVYTMDEMADDVIKLLDALQIREPVVLGGLSMGGYVALSAALRHSERFRALMLMDTRSTADSPEAARTRENTASRVLETKNTDEVVETMFAKLFSPMTRQNRAHVIDSAHKHVGKPSPRGVAGALRGMAIRPDRTQDLARLTLPTLVLVGADDSLTPPADSRTMAAALPNARLEIIPEAGHLAPLENPEVSNRIILSFLNGLP